MCKCCSQSKSMISRLSLLIHLTIGQWKNKLPCLTAVSAYALPASLFKNCPAKKMQVTFLIQVTVSPQSMSWTAIPAMLRVCSGYKVVKPALPQSEMSKMT